jgi:hypothetical protein
MSKGQASKKASLITELNIYRTFYLLAQAQMKGIGTGSVTARSVYGKIPGPDIRDIETGLVEALRQS